MTGLTAPWIGEGSTLIELLRERARERPGHRLYTFLADGEEEAGVLTCGELDARARALGALLRQLAPGEPVLLLFPPGAEFVTAFFGCLYGGAVAVPAYPPRARRVDARLWSIFRDARPRVVLTTSAVLARLAEVRERSPELAAARWIATDDPAEVPGELAAEWRDPGLESGSVAFLQYTSGSTSSPKGVRVTHGNLLHNQALIQRAFGQTEESVVVGWLPLYHDMGLIGNVLQPLYSGARCVLMSPWAFLQSPARWLRAISRYRATTSGGPDFAYDLCVRKVRPEQRAGLDLSSWTVAFNGAEPVRAATLERFAEAFAPQGFRREAFHPCYGLAEATLLVSGGGTPGPSVLEVDAAALEGHRVVPGAGRALVGCGRPPLGEPDLAVRIVDPETGAPSGQVGEIWVAGPSVAAGYHGRPEESARTFQAFLPNGEGPFLRTGDLGFLYGGELFVTGRLKDLLILRGRNHYPQDVELTVERAHPGLRPGSGAAFAVEAGGEERLVVVQEVEHRTQPDVASLAAIAAAVRRAVSEEHELAVWDLLLVAPGTIPKTSSGKIQRGACRAAYLDGSLALVGSSRLARPDEAAAPAPDTEAPEPGALLALEPGERRRHLEDWLRRELAARLGEEPDAATPVTALGLDSLAAVELAGRIGAAARVAVSPADLLRGISLAELAGELAARLGEETAAAAADDLLAETAAPESFPLSRGQRALWFVERLAPGEAVYNLPVAARVSGPLDTGALRRALAALLARHPALRTEVRDTGGEPVQRVRERVTLDVWETVLETGEEEALAAEAWRPFDLAAEPPLRLRLFRTGSGVQLLLVVHHLAADFRSLAVLARELDELYRQETGGAPAALDPLPLRYADWVRWQERWLEGPRGERLWSYWSRKLAGELPALDLPGDRPRPPVQTYRAEARSLRLPVSRGAAGISLFTSLLATLQVLLHRFSGQEDLIVGAPFAGRTDPRLAGVVGYFVNPLPLRGDLSGDPTVAALLARARATVLEALKHQEYPFPRLAERLQPRRDPSRAPLFQALLVLQGTAPSDPPGLAGLAAGEDGARLRLGGLTLEAVPLPERRVPVDLSLTAAESVDGGLAATLEFNVDLYDAATAARLLAGFGTLLDGLAGDPSRRIADLPLLSPAERFQLLAEWSGALAADNEPPPEGLLHEPFQRQAELRPDATALVHGEERVSYGELSRRARDLAGHLRRLGVGPEVRVGVHLDRRPELAVSVLAVLEAGGAYVALDPAYPAERRDFLLKDSGARVLITRGEVVRLNGPLPGRPEKSPPLSPRNLAYVIYTSGSTGRPKGVALEHRSARALVEWARRAFPPEHLAGVLASTSVGFDLSVFELFVPLSLGGSVVLAADALALAGLPAAGEVTLVNTVPSAMAELLRLDALPSSVRAVNLAGEPFPPALAQVLPRRPGIERVLNLYGPSEDTTYSTVFQVERGEGPVPIGRPLPGTRAYVLDARLEPVPAGAAGELCLGGVGLARGYLDRPDLTAERFVPDPFAAEPGGRLYRTGDLARYRRDGDGELEFLGRIDHQVKVRGFRVELGEIEAALATYPGVREAVVAALGEGAGRYLAAYVAPPPGEAAELRDWLAARLPAFMVPSRFVALERLPRTPNGKVNRKALPAPVARPGDDTGPRTPTEERVAAVWAEVLGHAPAGVHEDFFLAGGHSLAAVRVVARLREVAGVELPITALFQAPTVAALAARVDAAEPLGEPPLVRRASEDQDLPLSFGQQRLWWLDRLEPGAATYVLAGEVLLPAALDVPVLAGALGEVVRRHEALRTVFPEKGDVPVQRVLPPAPPDLPVIDLSALEDEEGEARRLATVWARRGFDLARSPLLRTGLLRLGTGHRLLISIHHIAADGWSLGLFARELAALYEAYGRGEASPLPEPPVQYADFALWQRQWLAGGEMARQLAFWRRRLAGLEPLELPADRPRRPVRGSRGLRWPVHVPAAMADGLRRLAAGEGTTPFVALLAAFAALLARHAHREDLAVGTPVAQRSRPEVAGLIGFFVNTVAVRADLSGVPSFTTLLARVRSAVVEALAYQDAPFEAVVEELEPGRDPSRPPLVQTLFALAGEPPRLLGSRVEELDTGTAKVDLALTLAEEEDRSLSGTFEAPTDLFERSTVGRLAGHFLNLLSGAVAAPDLEMTDLELLSEAERHQVLAEWGSGGSPAPATGTVVDLFLAQAAQRPEAPALAWGEEVWTYGELRDRAARVARRLAARGIDARSVVALRAERSPEMVAALLGIFEAGGTFLPLDPAYPPERLAFLIADSGAALVLTHLETAEEGPEEMPVRPGPRDPAYLIYTSGTSGTPKGVLVEHASLLHTLRSILAETGFAPGERMPAIAPFSFDIFLFELLAPLLSGGTVSLLPLRPTLDIDLLARELSRSTRFHAVPAVLRQVVDRVRAVDRPAPVLREVYVGGDVVPAGLLADAREAFSGARVRVLYGPTEGTILATSWRVPADGPARPLLGRPLRGTVVRLLDPDGSPVPAGVPGEIHLGGPGVSRGYLGRPDLTAERYLPAGGGERLYRSGDLARWLPDGGLEFLGRADHQVKVRGFRIEPGEIEARLALHPGVRRAVVVPRGGTLAAFFVPEGPAPDRAELRAFLLESLPEPMVPGVFAPLPELPLTAHGKVDRRALAVLPLHEEGKAGEAAPRDPIEELLAGLWADLLDRERVGVHDSFFDLGGHSLLATRAVSRIREALGVEVPLRALFEAPTVAGLARTLRKAREARQAPAPPLTRRPRAAGEPLPLSFAQQRLWFLWRLAPESPFYNMQAALRLDGPLDERTLARGLDEIVRRHESLRTRFHAAAGGPVQVIAPPRPQPLPVVDLRAVPGEADRLALAEARRPFDLAREPLLRTTLLRLGPEERLLLVNMHHVVSDGWSVGVLYRELAALLPAFAADRPSPLPELPVQYADFTLWQREWLQGEALERELAYWRERLADLPATPLPADRPRPASPVFRGATLYESLPSGLVSDLRGFARRSGATLFMTLLAGFAALLQRYTGGDEVVLGSPVANRDRVELEGLVGFFVNTLVLRLDLSGRPGFRAAAARARETALGAWAHQAVPFERLVEELAPEREASTQPFFQTMFQLVEVPPARLDLGDVSLERLEVEQGTTTFDLALDLVEGVEGEGLEGILIKAVHSTDLFDEPTVRRLVGHFTVLLAAAVAEPERPVSELPILGEAERRQLLEAGVGLAIPESRQLVHEAFAARAVETPGAVAVVCGEDSVTYGELARRVYRLAHHLRRMGVAPEVPVGVSLERSPEMIVGLLGVLAAGGVYLPLDPALPAERLRFLREDAGAAVVVTSRLLAELPGGPEEDPRVPIPGEALAYLIYTSGSTGVPKGVGVSHRAAAAHARAVAGAYGLSPDDAVLQFASASFDVSLEQILPALAAGARLVLRPAQIWEPGELLRRLGELGLTVADLPTAYWGQLAREAARPLRQALPEHRLRLVLAGGEAMPAEPLRQWRNGPLAAVRLLNAYGPTETTVTAAAADLAGRGPGLSGIVPIGRAFPGRTLYVLDTAGEVVPLGVPGELCIGGDLLARGYLGRPELTAERFVPDPFADDPGGRLYRTGDRVRRLADGELEFLGRIDQQVKIRGFRIEPGEVEAALAAHPAVREAVVVSREAPPADHEEDRRLVAYVTLDPDRVELPERLEDEQVAEWQAVYDDDVYGELADPAFNIRGWNSSYTRGPIPEEDMREWLDGTVGRILARGPRRVLEIGCGTGLVLFRVAPHCERYLGTDFSRVALGHVRAVLDRQGGIPGVELRQAEADDAGALDGERFDTVVLNSVVQYFPSASYLIQVLERAVARVEPGGFVFVGDVRSLPLLDAFHASVELYRAPSSLPRETLARRVEAGVAADPELVLDPAFFAALRSRLPRITHVEVQLRRGRRDNELTRFRYDVVLSIERRPPEGPAWVEAAGLAELRERLVREAPEVLAVRGIPNARVREDLEALAGLRSPAGPRTAGELRQAAERGDAGIEPEDLWNLASSLGYEAGVTWSADPGAVDVVFRRGRGAEPLPGLAPAVDDDLDWERLSSHPLRAKAVRALAPRLRDFVAERLPSYMVPAVMVLDALPLTASGKVDRRALPDPLGPDSGREPEAGFVPPRSAEERALAGLWSELLGIGRVGAHDNFFALGGHSLLATQVVSRIRQTFAVELELRHVFEEPTLAGLAGRLRGVLAEAGRLALPPIEPVSPAEIDGRLPLSFGQQRLWFLDRMEPGRPGYLMAGAFRLTGTLDVPALEAAMTGIVRRHEALRTTFHGEGGEPFQTVQPPGRVPLPVIDFSGVADAAAEARRLSKAEAARPFDLERDLMLRATLLRLGAAEHAVLVTLHHIASDGWSIDILVRELAVLYAGQEELPELPVQYGDYAVWQRRFLDGPVLAGQLAAWRRRLDGAPAALDLPTDRPRPPVRSTRAGRRSFVIPPRLEERLRGLATREGATLYVLLLSAFAALLSRLSHQEDLTVGTPVAGRRQAEVEGLIGFFVNTLVMRADLAGDPGFLALLGRTHATALDAFAHQDLPFERLVEELRPERSLARTPLFQVMFAFQHATAQALELPGVTLEPLPFEPESRFDLELTLAELPDGLRGTLDYALDLFDPSTAARLAESLIALLEQIAARPYARLSDLRLLRPGQAHQLLAEWGEGPPVPEGAATIVDLFAAQAERTPDAAAVVAGEETLTYAALHHRSDQLAARLNARGQVVGLRTGRTADLAVGLLGILKAGAIYLPLDPSYPEERLAFLTADAGATLVLGGGASPPGRGEVGSGGGQVGGSSLAYLIYTSGTTGQPKGVEVEHRSLAFTLATLIETLGFSPGERMPVLAPSSFDIFLFELLAPLLSGGTSVLIPFKPTLDLDILLEELSISTRLHAVPAVLRQVVDRVLLEPERYAGLREIHTGGDAVPADLLADLRRAFPATRIHILYGPTEATIVATAYPLGETRPLLGRPLPGVSVRLLDPTGRPVPPGVTGEIHLGGPGVSRGYRGRPDLTAERYLPANGGERLYRTGDLARWLPDGQLEFLGRTDVQLKVRGFRIEPGEIEARLAAHPGVRHAAVVARGPASGRRLAAFYVPDGPAPDAAELRAFLGESLPEHMVPGEIVALDELPLTPNGKVDRKALAARPEASRTVGEAPRTPAEEVLAGIWAEVLDVDEVGIDADFFELGGHSLLATRLVSRVREAFHVELPLRALFEAPTVAGLARRIEEASRTSRPPLRPEPRGEEVPLSFAQQRLWFIDQMEPGSPLYNVPAVLRLSGRLDPAALERALDEVVRRHEVLRTTFPATRGRPRQEIAPKQSFTLPVVDLAGLPPHRASEEALHKGREESRRSFDLKRGPVMRALLLRLADDEHALALTLHHIVSDGWSVGVLIRELAALYGAGTPLPELPVQYADFAIWQRRWLAGEALEEQLAWWRGRLAGAPAALELPTDTPRPPVRSISGTELPVALPAGLRDALVRLGRREGATLFMVLLAAFQALLHRWTGQDDLTVGTPVSGRNQIETEGLIGFFVNTLVLRSTVEGRPSFRQILASAREAALGAWARQDLPFERLVEELEPRRDPSRTPLFQALVALLEGPAAPSLPGLSLRPLPISGETAKFDLSLLLSSAGDGVAGILEYAAGLFDRTTVLRLAAHFQNLLAGVVEDPERALGELPLLGAAERHQVTLEWRGKERELPGERAVHELFEEQARSAPDRVALSSDLGVLTYGELNRRANRLAHGLRRRGVGLEVPVAVLIERSADFVVAVLAVLKAGGVYVPLDPTYPAERLAFLREDCGARIVLTAAHLPALAAGESDDDPGVSVLPDNLAYVIYTSGSTGRPKGVEVNHRAIVRLAWRPDYVPMGAGDRVTQLSNVSFDAATFEIWGALLNGATLAVFPPQPSSLQELGERIEREEITVLWSTTGLFNQMVDGPLDRLGSVSWVVSGGETGSAAHMRKLLAAHPGCTFAHVYGPTENTTFTTCGPVKEVERVSLSIGRPIAGTIVHLLDRELRPVPAGVAGELLTGGDGLARGYLRRPERTAEAFVPDPLGAPGARLYRTGDLARWLPDGSIEFLGRFDHQVKVRGFRVELGEIEAAAVRHPAVLQAVALFKEHRPGDRRLVLWAVPAPGVSQDTAGLRVFLESELPGFMVPASIGWLDVLPVTPHGKADRRALAALEVVPERAAGRLPRTPVEERLGAIWSEVLGREEVGIDDDFFELGGHSLLATQVASRVREELAAELPLKEVFARPRLVDLADWIEEERRRGAGLETPPVVPVPRPPEGLPLSFAQEWMWVVDQLDPESGGYNAPVPLKLLGALDIAALEGALGEVARRHEVLRMAFVSGSAQVPLPPGPVPFAAVDLSALPEPEAAAERLALEEARRPFDLAAGRPFRALLLRLAAEDHRLVINLHHIVTDGWSAGVLLRETAGVYEALRTGSAPSLPPLPVQYADFAVWQRRWITGEVLDALLGYWRERLAGDLPMLELPADAPRGTAPAQLGERLPFTLEKEVAGALATLGRRRGATLFATLLAVFETLLARYSQQDDLLVGTPVAGRTRRETEGLIGYFVNNLVLRTDLSGDPPFPRLVDRVQETSLGAWSHQDLPLMRLIQELHPERSGAGGAMPLFQAWFQLQNTPPPSAAVPGLELASWEVEMPAATFDLELLAMETGAGLAGHLVFDPARFRRATAERMLRHFLALAEAVSENPDRRLSELPMLSDDERRQLLHGWNPSVKHAGDTPLHVGFATRAAAAPGAPAVTFEGETLSYGELDRRANRLARHLITLGVGPESRVGLSMERSVDLVVAILGILKAGGAYVPLDPDYPRERLDLLAADSGLSALVKADSLKDLERYEETAPAVAVGPDHLAYVIYTSGSTGRPKGVMVTHRQAARLFEASGLFGFGPEDVWTLFHSYAFDFSVWELWGALLFGGRLVVVPRWVSRSAEAFRELLARERVTVLNQTPSAFYPLIQADEAAFGDLALRWIVFGGEALEPRKLRPWWERHGDRRPALVNMFGITETTVHVTLRPLALSDAESGASVIGSPLPDLRIYLLDRHLQPVPMGVAGEVCVGGGGVARGYLGRPELTAARFVPDPFSRDTGARLYRSGDLARRRADGELEYLGRADQQLKVRGFRIEPGEIETALVRHPAVAEAVVTARVHSAGDVRLVAFLAPRAEKEVPAAAELRAFLLGGLPEHMVPSSFVALPALPLTAHGKVDRRALDRIETGETLERTPAAGAPLTPFEEALAALWAGLLEVDTVGRDESFFALGGHSLLMTRVASRVREALGVSLPMKSFFDRPTLAGMAASLVDEMGKKVGDRRLEELLSHVEALPEERVTALVEEKKGNALLLAPTAPRPVVLSEAKDLGGGIPNPQVLRSAQDDKGGGVLAELVKRRDLRLGDVVAVMNGPEEDALRVTSIGFPTANRPEVLERGLRSYAEASRHRRFMVMDDSRDPAVREEYRRRLAGLRRELGVEVVYAGLEEKRRFVDALTDEGIPPEVARIALLDPEGIGLTVGANRNALLLQTVGEGVLSVDDDTLSQVAPPPDVQAGVAFLSGTSPGTAFLSGQDPGEVWAFPDRAGALGGLPLQPHDLAGLHESALGRPLRSWLSGFDPESPVGLADGDPGFLRRLEEGGRVRITTNGWVGDCGWHSPTFYMLLTGGSRRRLLSSEEGYRAGTASKEIVRYVPRPTVGNGDSFMATLFTGLDNRDLLPPFPPVLWGEDLLFGITLQLCFPDARVGHLPWVAAHAPLEFRAFWPGEMTRSASGVDHSRMVSALLDGFDPDPGGTQETELRRLGNWLTELGRMEPAAFDDLARRSVRARAAAFAADLERRLETLDDDGPAADLWAADVHRYLDLLRRHAAEPEIAVPLDLLYGRSVDEARRLAQKLLLHHGLLLAHWPDVVAAARALKARGRELAEEIL